jgi:hypothetical protein
MSFIDQYRLLPEEESQDYYSLQKYRTCGKGTNIFHIKVYKIKK